MLSANVQTANGFLHGVRIYDWRDRGVRVPAVDDEQAVPSMGRAKPRLSAKDGGDMVVSVERGA